MAPYFASQNMDGLDAYLVRRNLDGFGASFGPQNMDGFCASRTWQKWTDWLPVVLRNICSDLVPILVKQIGLTICLSENTPPNEDAKDVGGRKRWGRFAYTRRRVKITRRRIHFCQVSSKQKTLGFFFWNGREECCTKRFFLDTQRVPGFPSIR